MQLPQNVIIKQDKTLDVKSKHKFSITAESGKVLYHVYEESNTATRLLLKKKRPIKIKVVDTSMNALMIIERPYYMSFAKYYVTTGKGSLATIERKFSASSRVFEAGGFTCKSKYTDPWNYQIKNKDNKVGHIKNDSGVLYVDLGKNRPLLLAMALAVLYTMFAR